MAAVTLLGSASFDTNSGTHTVTATPAVGDLIVLVIAETGSVTQASPTDDQAGGTYSQIQNATKATSADLCGVWIRDSLIPAATSTVFSYAPGATTGGGLAVLKVTGMSRAGSAAKRGNGAQLNQTSGTPAPVMGTPLTTNPIISAVFNATSPGGVTVRSSPAYTSRVNTGYGSPTTGICIMSIDSGETNGTITWGSSSASAFCSVAVELDSSDPLPRSTQRWQLQQLLAQ